MITFEKDKRKSKNDPETLPQSMVEKYGSEIKQSRKELRRQQQNAR